MADTHISFVSLLYLKLAQLPLLCRFFFLTFITFPHISSFIKIPIPPKPASFPDHHSLYLRPEVPTKRAPWPFHPTSCMQHTSTLFFLSSSHTSVFLPQRLATFNLPNLFPCHSGLNPKIFRKPSPFKSCRELGAI